MGRVTGRQLKISNLGAIGIIPMAFVIVYDIPVITDFSP